MSIKLTVLIFGLCSQYGLKKDFKQPINAQEVYAIQTAARRCNSIYKTCLGKVHIKRYKIGGSHLSVSCGPAIDPKVAPKLPKLLDI